eukprot:5201261-Alexandrium_andersonii.AAC.1
MSASLVGSEMCIRDRFSNAAPIKTPSTAPCLNAITLLRVTEARIKDIGGDAAELIGIVRFETAVVEQKLNL